ncbi:MAG: glycosyltransferase family 4 protein [Patescibacteria group bacterium]|nr:glycosyltransferase family 4 protein [Patescibacteria group bacterium]
MNIIFVTRLYSPHLGGVEKVVENLAVNLVKRNHKVCVITSKHDLNLPDSELIKGVQIIRIWYPRVKFLGIFIMWCQMVKLLLKILRSDIVHIHDVFVWYLPIRLILPFKKVYLTIHGWEGQSKIPIKSLLQKRLSCLLSTKTILVGSYLEKLYGVKGHLISYGGVDSKKKQFSPKVKNNLVYVGRLDRSADLQIILKVLKNYKSEYKITFIGDGDLSSNCKKIGAVTGFTDPYFYLEKSRICIAIGYLSTLESLAHENETIVVCANPIRKLAFVNAPFAKYIELIEDEFHLNFVLDKLLKTKSISRKTKLGAKFARKFTWDKLANDYLKIWNEK